MATLLWDMNPRLLQKVKPLLSWLAPPGIAYPHDDLQSPDKNYIPDKDQQYFGKFGINRYLCKLSPLSRQVLKK